MLLLPFRGLHQKVCRPAMLFNSSLFLVFVIAVMALYAAFRRDGARRWLILVASYVFYGAGEPRWIFLLLLTTIFDWFVGLRMGRATTTRARNTWLVVSLVQSIGLLSVFKYGHMLATTFGAPSDTLAWQAPAGISFYTFHTMSYVIDVWRRTRAPCASLLDFALYVAYFPQLVAGPIMRAGEFLPQVERMPDLRMENIALGAQRFALGLFKKIAIADNVALFVDSVFVAPGNQSSWVLWMALYGFSLQMYCDFSAYTDMALGVARAFGIKLVENFDAPYLARSITEFWRRWHLSLSRWLRDYLYVSLGGNRKGSFRSNVNLFITMLLGGLWHGANWTYVVWGGYQGVCLIVERKIGVARDAADDPRWTAWLKRILMFHVLCLSWTMFRAPDFASSMLYASRLFTH